MRTLLTFLCLWCGPPAEAVVDNIGPVQRPKVDRYRALISELETSDLEGCEKASDLPADLKRAIDTWTGDPSG